MEKTARAIIIKDNMLLVFFRRKIKDGKEITYYAIPGGHLEDDETLEETCVREIKEELNLDIEIIDYLGNIIVDNKCEYYYYVKIVGGELKFGGEELERNCYENYYEIRWISLDDLDTSGIRAIDLIKKVVWYYENRYIFK